MCDFRADVCLLCTEASACALYARMQKGYTCCIVCILDVLCRVHSMRYRTEELLSHELCEEVYVDSVSGLQASEHDDTQTGGIMLHRGPRLKSGIAMGPILAALNTVTGRMAYRGKVM